MNREVYERTIRKEFDFAKDAKTLADLWQREIEVPNGGCMIPLSYLHLEDEALLAKLSDWRRAASYAYPTRFKVTTQGTRKWAKEAVLDKADRILFLLHDAQGQLVGHLGFANAINNDALLEIDNVLRGEPVSRRELMAEALAALLNWGRTVLFANGFFLRVLASNGRAIDFYRRNGFAETERRPLRMVHQDGTDMLVPTDGLDGFDDEFIRMAPIERRCQGKSVIRTAGPSIGFREQVYAGDAVRKGWNSEWNKYIKQFEEEFCRYVGAQHALSTSSCTGALHIALMALGIGPGDEVILPEITWVATANAVHYVGAKPVFADVDAGSWCIDPSSIEELITSRTKAVIPVHLYGHPCEMDPILRIAEHNQLYVVEDAAPSIGAECKKRRTGSFGHFAAFSFQGAKLAVTGEGGMLVTSDPELYQKAYAIWDQGRKPGTFMIVSNGLKYKMSNLQAAIGLGQLQRNDEMVEAKRRIHGWYADNLRGVRGIELCKEASWAKSIFWMSSITVDGEAGIARDDLMAELGKRNIDSRPVFPAISQYPIWEDRDAAKPVAKRVGDNGINLPSGVCLSKAEVDYICEAIREILGAS
jgi:perosamine synthetase